MRMIDADALYERACELEAQALSYVGKIVSDETKTEEWRIWSAILAERTAFKHDVFDAPTIEKRKPGHWIDTGSGQECSVCGEIQYGYDNGRKFCANCGADMRGVILNDIS